MESCPRCATPIPGESRVCPACGDLLPDPGATIASTGLEHLAERVEAATNGRLKVVRELGRGAMGIVFLAHQVSLGRMVAIKILHPYLQATPEIAKRFNIEVQTQAVLSHPNILTILDVCREGGLTFFLSTFVESVSLRAYLKQNPQPPVDEVIRILTELGGALDYAHSNGIVHRDVKPENVIVDSRSHRMILTDFGIAKVLSETDSSLTRPHESLGTPLYMAPEQADDSSMIDGRSDQYSLGLIGYEMLSGKTVFDAKTYYTILDKQRHSMPTDIARLRPDAPPRLSAAIMRAIQKRPEQRFPTMADFVAAIALHQPPPSKKAFGERFSEVSGSSAGKVVTFALCILTVAVVVYALYRIVMSL